MYYRCQTRTMVPGAAALETHPVAVYLREDQLREEVNLWLGEPFAPENVDDTVAALLASQTEPSRPAAQPETLKKRLVADAVAGEDVVVAAG